MLSLVVGGLGKNMPTLLFWKQSLTLSEVNNYYKDTGNLANCSFNALIFGE